MQEDGRRSVEQHAALYVCSVSGPTSHTNSCSGIKLLRLHLEWEEKKHVSLLMGQDYWRWEENIRLCVIVFKSRPPSIFMKKSSAARSIYLIINVFFLPFALSSTSGSLEELLQRQGGKLASFPETRRILPVKPLWENKYSLLSWKQIQKNNFLPLLAAFSQRTHWQHSRPPRSLERAHV